MAAKNKHLRSRARIGRRFALFPLTGYPTSRLPAWEKTEARVLAAPAMGAEFVQYLLKVEPGGGTRQKPDSQVETFFYLLSGEASLSVAGAKPWKLATGAFALLPPNVSFELQMQKTGEILALRKIYEPADEIPMFSPLIGNESAVPALPWMNNKHSRLQTLIPDDLQYDLAMNIFSFDPGHGLPYVETHVMEHGLYFLQGKGDYFLEDTWMKAQAGDFIWMGPYCPQCFIADKPVPAKYIYYKNVNREIPL
jgi:(S)-ureidoglycine aminohydrolase